MGAAGTTAESDSQPVFSLALRELFTTLNFDELGTRNQNLSFSYLCFRRPLDREFTDCFEINAMKLNLEFVG
jgi:hypothetical protein